MDTACALVGIDVSKKKLDVAMLVSGKIKAKVVENTAEGHKSLLAWLSKSSVPRCRQYTSVWKPLESILSQWRWPCIKKDHC